MGFLFQAPTVKAMPEMINPISAKKKSIQQDQGRAHLYNQEETGTKRTAKWNHRGKSVQLVLTLLIFYYP